MQRTGTMPPQIQSRREWSGEGSEGGVGDTEVLDEQGRKEEGEGEGGED